MAGMKLDEAWTYAAEAAANLSASQNRFVKLDTDGKLVLCGDNEKPLGTLYEAAALGAFGSVAMGSILKVVAGAAIAAGARVACGSNGLAKTSTGTNPVGIALNAADTSDLVMVAMVG